MILRALDLLHRWTGGLVGLLLAVIGLSGTALVWEEAWIGLPGAGDPLQVDAAALGTMVDRAVALHPGLSRVTFADAGMALHQVIYTDGGGAYLTQAGAVADQWDSFWGRPELWVFELHHYLFLGEPGKYTTGVLGLLLLAFAITGAILWWQTRKTFRFRLWPARMTRTSIVRHHRDLGIVAAPLLILTAATGTFMVFPAMADAVLSPWADPARAPAVPPTGAGAVTPQTDWRRIMANGRAAFPDALPRRLMLPRRPGAPAVLRLRQSFEWTPNGRTYVYLDPATGAVMAVEDPATGDTANAISETFYPVHSGKVGGILWRLALTFTGLTLTLLGTFTFWTFWFRQPKRAAPPALQPAE